MKSSSWPARQCLPRRGSDSVDVYLDGAQVKRIKACYARELVAWKRAEWCDSSKRTVTLLVTEAKLHVFLRRKKNKPAPEIRALDSKTWTSLPGGGFMHVHERCEYYSPLNRRVIR